MVNQASETDPPQFTVELTNESSQSVNIGYGQTLMFSAGRTESPEELVIVPAADEADKRPNSPTGGCWKYPENQEVTAYAVQNNEMLANGESLPATFALYSPPDVEACYPPGEYEFQSQVSLDHRQSPQLLLSVVISIDESGRIEVEGEPPDETP